MKHAGAVALSQIEPLLVRLRALPSLKEKSPGCFYFKSRGFLHFHEDPKGMFADIRATDGNDFERLQVDDPSTWNALIETAAARSNK